MSERNWSETPNTGFLKMRLSYALSGYCNDLKFLDTQIEQIEQSQFSMLLEVVHCLLFHLHHLEVLHYGTTECLQRKMV